MAVVNRPDYSVGVWASNGDIAAPTSEKIEIGHIVEKPLKEVMNWIQNRQDRGIVYLFQQGISEWVSTETYPENGYVKRAGVIYKSLSQNTDRDPLTYTDIWRQAFDTFGSAAEVQLEVDKIKTQEGYLNLYVSKANPEATGKFYGTSYVANIGLSATGNDNFGYSFVDNENDGLFHDGQNPIILKNGEVAAIFDKPSSVSEYSKKVVTMDVLLEYIQLYKVGDLYLTTNGENPSTHLGYGTWARYAEGKALVGFSTSTSADVPEWTKIGGGEAGEYSVKLTGDNIAPHTHYAIRGQYGGDSDLNVTNNIATSANRTESDYKGYVMGGTSNKIPDLARTSNPVGSNGLPNTEATAHNNVQPSITVYVWRRIA